MAKVTINTIKNINPSDLTKMTKAQLRELLDPASEMVKERVERFEKNGLSSPAYRAISEHGKIKVSGTRQQMINEIMTARRFLTSKTGTVTGARAYMRTTREMLGLKGVRLDANDWKNIWQLIDEAKESTKGISSDIVHEIVTQTYIDARRHKPTKKDKEALLHKMASDPRYKTMAQDIKLEDMTNGKYILYKSLLSIQKEYERQQTVPGFFRVNR